MSTLTAAYLTLLAWDPFTRIQGPPEPALDFIAIALSRACEGWALLVILLLVTLSKEGALSTPDRWKPALVAFGWSAAALLAAGVLSHEIKVLLHTPRPLGLLGPERVRVLMEPLRENGMPSGHSTAVATLAISLGARYRGRTAVLFAAFAVLGGLSRVYVGDHWLFDVIGGLALGAAVGLALHAVSRRFELRSPVEDGLR